jgi:hypothetical protein
MADDTLKLGFAAQAASLRDFGYPDVTADDVATAHGKWLKAEPMKGIIEMMCEGAFNDYPKIFGSAPE